MATYSDDFNRADSGTLGAPWVEFDNQGGSSQQIVTNRDQIINAVSGAAVHGSVSVYNNVFTDDQYCKLTFESILSTGVGGPGARMTVVNIADSTGYWAAYNGTDIKLYELTNYNVSGSTTITATQIGSTYTVTLISGDTVELEAIGSAIKVYVNDVERITATDSAHLTGGQASIIGHAQSNAATKAIYFTAFEGGDETPPVIASTSGARSARAVNVGTSPSLAL